LALDVLAVLLAVVGIGLAGWQAAVVLRARRRREQSEFERALDLARQAEHRVPADRRRALALLARLLGEERVGVEARELAWSKPEPSPAALSEVVDEIEQGARRQ
jgi:hypothetical protein